MACVWRVAATILLVAAPQTQAALPDLPPHRPPVNPHLVPTTTVPTSTTEPVPTPPQSLLDLFLHVPNAAINMRGSSYYVNYRSLPRVTLEDALRTCVSDATCLSLDIDVESSTAWLHRIPSICASEAGASFVTSNGVDFYEFKPEHRAWNESTCNLSPVSGVPEGSDPQTVGTAALLIFTCVVASVLAAVIYSAVQKKRMLRREANFARIRDLVAARRAQRNAHRAPAHEDDIDDEPEAAAAAAAAEVHDVDGDDQGEHDAGMLIENQGVNLDEDAAIEADEQDFAGFQDLPGRRGGGRGLPEGIEEHRF